RRSSGGRSPPRSPRPRPSGGPRSTTSSTWRSAERRTAASDLAAPGAGVTVRWRYHRARARYPDGSADDRAMSAEPRPAPRPPRTTRGGGDCAATLPAIPLAEAETDALVAALLCRIGEDLTREGL